VGHLERRNGVKKVEKSDKKEPKGKSKIEINKDLCKGCGICIAFCQKKVLQLDEQDKAAAVRPEDCNACMLCELRCPDMALEIKGNEGE
jgi:2-oxoglutarate ferredoxin oxidoreductase subunit delta